LTSRDRDPVDHARTFRQHAGETLSHRPHTPGVYGAILAAAALVIGLYAIAAGQAAPGFTAVIGGRAGGGEHILAAAHSPQGP
jgi:hypothetical protein